MQIRVVKFIFAITFLCFGMMFGMAVQKFHLPPYGLLANTYTSIRPYLSKKNQLNKDDYAKLAPPLSIREKDDANRLRTKLINFLWGEPNIPSTIPNEVVKNFSDNRYNDLPNLSRIDKITIRMEFGLESRAYHFIPRNSNNKVILFHEGHNGDFYRSKDQIRKLLDSGYSVVALCMPLMGLNNNPAIEFPNIGVLTLERHDHLKFLTPNKGHPIKYFIEPVVSVLNYLEHNFKYSFASMFGFSGGGWTATVASAVDERIKKSFPVAGSYPLYLRYATKEEWGDYEQNERKMYETANYVELYILGAYGKNREQLQVFNLYDPCCFGGTLSETYKDTVKNSIRELGEGKFDIFLDDTHRKHGVSDEAMKRILAHLAS